MASLLLGDRVITALPSPDGLAGVQDLKHAVRSAPRYGQLLRALEDYAPLWQAGILTREYEGEAAMDDVRHAVQSIHADPRCEALRRFVDLDRFAGDPSTMDALAHDMLRAGPDPAISVPLASGLDTFASRNGLVVVRGAPDSIAQRAELKMATDRFRVALPMIVQADMSVIMHARESLSEVRSLLGTTMRAAFESDARDAMRTACETFSGEFADATSEFTRDVQRDDLQVRIETLSVRGMSLPPDAVIRSSLIAARSFDRHASKPADSALAERHESALAPTHTLIISPVVRRG